MKGIVFTEFIEMVESKFGFDMMDDIIESANLPSGGIYTAVGTYDHTEMVQLVIGLSKRTEIPVDLLLKTYGKHLFRVFTTSYSHFFKNIDNVFDFFEQIDRYIHVEVQKLYPDAELPKFDTLRTDDTLEMLYQSDRKMADLADGLIEAAIEYFQEAATVEKKNMNEDGSLVKFIISKI
ncbi:heme NO-binding domain-containing protein [Emticicia sp. W12TSBA100-4]|uniref:heme NO-binding domain-containing protein n=1 Tax=Emticicia sp. W12TSBA100-4 TaxID=3160965 RepID=UPI003305D0D3